MSRANDKSVERTRQNASVASSAPPATAVLFSSGRCIGEVGAAGSRPFNAYDVGAGGASTCGITSLELRGPCSFSGFVSFSSATVIWTTSGGAALEDEDCAARDSATAAKVSCFN